MTLIRCKYCGAEISDKAKYCVKCTKKTKTAKKGMVIGGIIGALVLIVSFIVCKQVIKYNNIKKEQLRQSQIKNIKEDIDEYYCKADFESIETCMTQLEELNYDTSDINKILEYDIVTYPLALDFYFALRETQNDLQNHNYTSIKNEFRKLKKEFDKFDELEINEESKIGQWIQEVRTSADYIAFKTAILNDEYINKITDDSFTEMIFADVLSGTMKPLLNYEFPIRVKEE